MQGLVLSDIHSRMEVVEKVVGELEQKPDFVLILGDMTNYGDGSARQLLEILESKKVFAIPGNMDSWEVLKEIEEIGISVHGKKVKIGEFNIVGFGGGLKDWAGRVLYSEKEIEQGLQQVDENSIMLTHLPPKDTAIDLGYNGMHFGSAAVKKVIREKQPKIHLCGHVHEAKGETMIEKTKSINVGAVKGGNYLLLQIGKEISFERKMVR